MSKANPSLTYSSVQHIKITPEYTGQRIDNFLVNFLKGLPKSRLYRLIRKGEIRVNKKRVKAEYKLQAMDELRLPPLYLDPESNQQKTVFLPSDRLADFEARIVYEDEGLLILNKPSGMPVHGGSEVSLSVIDVLRKLRPRSQSLELVHRLDKGTSGCLMVAKKRSVLRFLHESLRKQQIRKEYLVLVAGHWSRGAVTLSLPLLKNHLSSGERRVRVAEGGKEATTDFSPEAFFSVATLMRASLHTGRTHQIRVQAEHVGHPVVGDDKYGKGDAHNVLAKQIGCKRLFLHAHELELVLPDMAQPLVVRAALEPDLKSVLQRLQSLTIKEKNYGVGVFDHA